MNFEIGPAPVETIVSLGSCDVESVIVDVIDLRERFDKVNGVAFISRKLRPDRMRIDCDPQWVSPISLLASEKVLLAFRCRGLRVVGLLAARIALTDACRFTTKSAEVIELRSSHASSFDQIDVVDDRCV